MRAASLESPRSAGDTPLTITSQPDPIPAAGELLLKVSACAVCRTDLQICEGDLKARLLPIIPGHQAIGIVEELGEGVEDWQVGEHAGVAWLADACGNCSRCNSGNENLCETSQFTGWDRDGGFAEFMTVRADFAHSLPSTLDPIETAPLLCGGIIGYRALRLSGISHGGRLGLYGFGSSARLTLQIATYWGCEVFVATRSKRDQQHALSLGATWAGGTDDLPPVALDAAITFAPAGEVVVAALKAVDRGGTVAINAIHLDRIPEFSYEHLWWERTIRSVANFTRQDSKEFLALATKIPIRAETEVYNLDAANQILTDLAEGRTVGTAVIKMSQ
ncbi:MAG TPA: alcohol dehydrogenase [Dehalococcoidia bacterium]|nr:alcohol dehydrogenase [Dehalococcoidia bacterium]|tara:strand:+ start:739 stop:1740 length:1002 start_codon:yes stop_codon:yes gene_type:complete